MSTVPANQYQTSATTFAPTFTAEPTFDSNRAQRIDDVVHCGIFPHPPLVDPQTRPAYVVVIPSTDTLSRTGLGAAYLITELRACSETSTTSSVVRAALKAAYELEHNSMPRKAAKQLMHFIESNARVHELAATNRLLVELDTQQLGAQALTGVVRATARMKNVLPAWNKTYSRAWVALSEKGKNPQAMFVGMDRPQEGSIAPDA